ncbi:MAG: alpha/beta hydrolase [Actinomycetes bacterium]
MNSAAFIPTARFLVKVDGGDLALFRYGPESAATPVLLVHGVTSSNRAFQLLAQSLIARGYLPYAVDLRGRGDSNQLPGPFGMRSHAKDLVAVIDYLGLESIDVIGHSMGAFVAVVLAGLYPDRVAKTVLIDGGIPLPLPPGMTIEQILPLVLGPALARLAMKFSSKAEYREYWKSQAAFNKGWSPAMDEYVDYDLRGQAPELHAATNVEAVIGDNQNMFGDTLISDSLKGLRDEVLFVKADRGLQNEEGGLYPVQVLEHVLPTFPKLKLVIIPDTNHYDILLEATGAEKCAQLIYGDPE